VKWVRPTQQGYKPTPQNSQFPSPLQKTPALERSWSGVPPSCAISGEHAIQSRATHAGGQQKIVEARSGFTSAGGRLVYSELLIRAGALPSCAFYRGQGSSRHNQWYDIPHRSSFSGVRVDAHHLAIGALAPQPSCSPESTTMAGVPLCVVSIGEMR
jgi:hypothetical protein